MNKELAFIGSSLANKLATCPHCDAPAGGATGVSFTNPTPTPKPGDVAICTRCRNINQYDAQLMLEPLPPGELEYIQRKTPKLYKLIQQLQKGGPRG